MCQCKIAILGFILIFVPLHLHAQENPDANPVGDIFGELLDTLGNSAKEVVQEKVDEIAGTYSGRLDEVRLVERRGNRIVLDVTYKGIKASDGVTVKAQVLNGGVPLEGFSTQLAPISGREGHVRLTISRNAVDEGWGLAPADQESDQIRLYLVRETHPDRPFGELIYDLPKTWTGSSEPDQAPDEESVVTEEGDGSIELAEGETLEEESSPSSSSTGSVKPYYPAGVVLTPTVINAAKTTAKPAPAVKQQPQIAQVQVITPLSVNSYEFYAPDKVANASWQGPNGKLTVGMGYRSMAGMVRALNDGYLSTGNRANKMIQISLPKRPDGRNWIKGVYPVIRIGNGLHFRATAGFLKGARSNKGAVFSVVIIDVDAHKRIQAARRIVGPREYGPLHVDLSRWAGKRIQIELVVDATGVRSPDTAVWVYPRISK